MDATTPGASPTAGGRFRGRLLARLRLHRHRVDPDLSALVSFPSCRCGALLWPEGGGLPTTAEQVESERPPA